MVNAKQNQSPITQLKLSTNRLYDYTLIIRFQRVC